MADYIITLCRGYGSNGRHVAQNLSEKLDIAYYDRDLIQIASDESGVDVGLFGRQDETAKRSLFRRRNSQIGAVAPLTPDHSDYTSSDNLFALQAETIKRLARQESCIIVGRCADFVLREFRNVVRVYIYATREKCAATVAVRYGMSMQDALKRVEKLDHDRGEYYYYNTQRNWKDPANYDLCVNSTNLPIDQCADIIIQYLKVTGKIE